MVIDYNKEIYEGWTVNMFINELKPQIDQIMLGFSWRSPFKNKKELAEYCRENQPFYKKNIPDVVAYFAKQYLLK